MKDALVVSLEKAKIFAKIMFHNLFKILAIGDVQDTEPKIACNIVIVMLEQKPALKDALEEL